jgi:hypothetical protein
MQIFTYTCYTLVLHEQAWRLCRVLSTFLPITTAYLLSPMISLKKPMSFSVVCHRTIQPAFQHGQNSKKLSSTWAQVSLLHAHSSARVLLLLHGRCCFRSV